MTLRDAIHRRLVDGYHRSGLTLGQLSERTGLCRRTLDRLLNGETLSLVTVETVARTLRVSLVLAEEPNRASGQILSHPPGDSADGR